MPSIDMRKLGTQLKELGAIEVRLNERMKDRAFRKKLLSNPVSVLRTEGLKIPKNRQKQLTDFCRGLNVPPDAPLRLAADIAKAPDRGIVISIGIRF